MDGFTVGMMMLEVIKRTSQGLVGLHINKNIVIDDDAATKKRSRRDLETFCPMVPFTSSITSDPPTWIQSRTVFDT